MSADTGQDDISAVTLCVDLDGTLIRSDLLHESVFALLKHDFFSVLKIPIWLVRGKARLKAEIAKRVDIDPATLPYNEDLLEYLRTQQKNGRKLVLTTATDEKFANAVANHLKIFDEVIASDGATNNSGVGKAEKLVSQFGERGYVYAGNAPEDAVVWATAAGAITVGNASRLNNYLPRDLFVEKHIENSRRLLVDCVRAMRPYQWLKNALLFVPLLLAHKFFDTTLLIQVLIGFCSFSLCASSVYLLNDLLDIEADRLHPTKRSRPFAAGSIPITAGVVLIPTLLAIAVGLSLLLSLEFQVVLAGYYIVTLGYSFRLKRVLIIDVLVLAGLYTTRIIAGAAAIMVPPSFWILAFSMFIFTSLALVKRFTELTRTQNFEAVKGRGYRAVDLEALAQFGSSSAFVSVLVLALYIDGEAVQAMYSRPVILWALCPIVLYLISRVWLLARRGEVEDDPVLFFAKDRRSLAFIVLGGIALLMAR